MCSLSTRAILKSDPLMLFTENIPNEMGAIRFIYALAQTLPLSADEFVPKKGNIACIFRQMTIYDVHNGTVSPLARLNDNG